MKIVATTSCTEGLVFTHITTAALIKAAEKLNIDIKVETVDAFGVNNPLTEDDIKNSYAVIIVTDSNCDLDRFKNKKLICVTSSNIIKDPIGVFRSII